MYWHVIIIFLGINPTPTVPTTRTELRKAVKNILNSKYGIYIYRSSVGRYFDTLIIDFNITYDIEKLPSL